MPNTNKRNRRSMSPFLKALSDSSRKCAKCLSNIGSGYSIQCAECHCWFHSKCAGITVKILKAFSDKSWVCSDCAANVDDPDDEDENDPDVELLINQTAQLAKNLDNIRNSIKSLQTNYDIILKNYEDIQSSVDAVKQKYTMNDGATRKSKAHKKHKN